MRFARVLAFAAALLSGLPASAGPNTFTATGPEGGLTYDVEFVGAGALLATTSRAVYRSTDNGANWTYIREIENWSTGHLAVNPANRNQALLGTGSALLRTTDGGVSWTPVANLPQLATNYVGVVKFSADGSIAWMAQQNGGSLYRSVDAGVTWSQLDTGLAYPVFSIATDGVNAQLIYVRSAAGNFRSTDAGSTFTPINIALYVNLFSASRVTADTVLAFSNDVYRVLVSTNGGTTWVQTQWAPPLGRIFDFLQYVPGTAGKAIAMDREHRMLRTLDNGQTWTEIGPTPNGQIYSMAFDPADPAHILIATSGGIFETTNDGASWVERNRGLREGSSLGVIVSRAGGGATYLKNRDLASVYRRTDTGGWNPVGRASTPLLGYPASYNSFLGFYTLGISQQDPLRLYMARDGRFGTSGDGGVTWSQRSTVPYMTRMDVSPINDQVLFMGAPGNDPIRSVNGGVTWSSLAGHGLPVGTWTFAFDPTNANVVYAAVENHYPPETTPAVYKSVDGGANFTPTVWNPALNASVVWRLVHDPVRTNIVYLSAYHGVFKTTDGGATWTQTPLFDQGQFQAGAVDLIIDPESPDVLYASAWQRPALARSVNGGASWDVIVDSFAILEQFNSIALVPGTRNKIIAVRWNGSREIDFVARVGLGVSPASAQLNTAASSVWTVANQSAFAVSAVRLTATLPASSTTHTIQAASGNCTVSGSSLTCELGNVAAGGQTTVTVGYTPTGVGSWSATMSTYEPDDNAVDNTAQVTVSAPPTTGGGGGGGGGGRLDYLLLALLTVGLWTRHSRTPPLSGRRFPTWAAALKKH